MIYGFRKPLGKSTSYRKADDNFAIVDEKEFLLIRLVTSKSMQVQWFSWGNFRFLWRPIFNSHWTRNNIFQMKSERFIHIQRLKCPKNDQISWMPQKLNFYACCALEVLSCLQQCSPIAKLPIHENLSNFFPESRMKLYLPFRRHVRGLWLCAVIQIHNYFGRMQMLKLLSLHRQ